MALAETAIQAGQAAYFMTAHELVTDLGRAYGEGRLDRRSVPLPPKTFVTCHKGLGESLLAERDYRVNPGSSQRWDQACEYGDHS